MSGNVSKVEELGQCSELIGSIAKAMALVAPKMTKHARQSWIGMPPANFAQVLEQQVFLPTKTVAQQQNTISLEEMCRELLTIAVEDGLVVMAEGVRQPFALSAGDVVTMANHISKLLHPDHIIDCDAIPSIPDGWSILPDDEQLPNRVRGAFIWNKESQKDALHLDKGQKNGKWIEGNKLRKALAKQSVLNANVLDYLLANPHLIPEEWKGKAIFFWGTIYRGRDGRLCVRCLVWGGDGWGWGAHWLDGGWGDGAPAAVSAG